MNAHAFFLNLCAHLGDHYPNLHTATLFSSPSLEYKGRAFAMVGDDRIILRLSQTDLPEKVNIGWQYYKSNGRALFLTKWVEVPYYYRHDWAELTERALLRIRDTIGE